MMLPENQKKKENPSQKRNMWHNLNHNGNLFVGVFLIMAIA